MNSRYPYPIEIVATLPVNTKMLLIMFSFAFVAMFLSAYALVYAFDHATLSINKAYMALLMVGTMAIVNVTAMFSMYKSNRLRWWVLGLGTAAILLSLFIMRNQTAVDNEQFLRSMIPHHSSAILMCERAAITDPAIADLCDEIVATQREEIRIMEEMLATQP